MLDSRYVAALDLEPYFVDKSTGLPLANGIVNFWQDNARAVPKLVYTLTGNSQATYTYVPLPNPIILSAVGTFQDAAGNNIPVYYFPYDAAGNSQLYYITVTDQYGVEQFTRSAWPFPFGTGATPATAGAGNTNQLSNPQFTQVNFIPPGPLTITFGGAGTQTVEIAPNWILSATTNAAGNVLVQRTAIAGSSAYPYNPPYTLTITPGLNVTALTLTQKLPNTPDIWSPQVAPAANGFVAASILLAPNSIVTMNWIPSTGALQQLLNQNNLTGAYTQFTNTVQLIPALNPDTGDTGFVNIQLVLPTNQATTFSNVQVLGVTSNVQNVPFDQSTANRQLDQTFNYYNPLLQFKPIPSFLTGWDFPFNPAQFLGTTVPAFASGANTSNYFWDQLIVFQSTNSGAAISTSPSGGLRITATNATQFALIQYLPTPIAKKILNTSLSVNVSALTPQVGGLIGTISLWYTSNALLPSTGANNSIVGTLNAQGYPLTFHQGGAGDGWHEVLRNGPGAITTSTTSLLGNAQFTVQNSATTNFNNYGFSGWNAAGVAGVNTATFFAIVVGFSTLNIGQSIDIDSISLVPGNIPTGPAPKTQQEHIADCQTWYQKSFRFGVVPAQAIGLNTGPYSYPATTAGANNEFSCSYSFNTIMFNNSPNIIIYNPINANAQVYNNTFGGDCSLSHIAFGSNNAFTIGCTGNAGGSVGDGLIFHWTSDGRLGL